MEKINKALDPFSRITFFGVVVAVFMLNAISASATQEFNFETDIIEGERERPDLFLNLGSNPNAESILFLRKDFNDFHESSRKWRPGYLQQKKPEKAKN
jgi:hypothetical protein